MNKKELAAHDGQQAFLLTLDIELSSDFSETENNFTVAVY